VTVLFGSGNGAVSWVADTNIGPGPRTGHISFSLPNGGSAVFTVVQAAPTSRGASPAPAAFYPLPRP
jgi:hypothetical protein